MRFPSIPTFIRTFSVYNFASIRALPASYRGIQSPFLRNTTILSMPTIPFIGSIFSKPKDMTNYPVKKSDDEWQVVLSPRAFEVIREKDTQSSYDSTFDQHMPSEGVYHCLACNAPLYRANHKFKSGCGWPAYFDSLPGAVSRHPDPSMGNMRIEITCSNCGGHLGHVFKGERYPTPTDERHCVNSISLTFQKEGDTELAYDREALTEDQRKHEFRRTDDGWKRIKN